MKRIVLYLIAGFLLALPLLAQDRGGRGQSGPAAELSLVLGRPTDRSITLSVLSAREIEAMVEYGVKPGNYTQRGEMRTAKAGAPLEFELGSLQPNTAYYYHLLTRAPDKGEFRPEAEAVFHTQRAPGSAFVFALQGDSHPEREGKMFDPALYTQAMRNVAKDRPDFYITMGDDFSIERLIQFGAATQATVDQVYAHQRSFLGVVGQSAPLFLVNGNHEQAAQCNLDGTANSPAVFAGLARTRFYPLPTPGAFYSGDATKVANIGLLRDYYAWTWGDALFVVVDAYWHSPAAADNEAGSREKGQKKGEGRQQRDLWQVSIGDEQYRWLKQTLSQSKAKWKFVFAHHVLGTGRGGIEDAGLYEWGGKNRRGVDEFAQKRPGWEMPIHQLMAKNGVTIFFQGHDHIYAHQQLDGMVYQSCPNPADPTYQAFNRDAYTSGDILPNSGHLRVSVGPEAVKVDYVRSFLPADEKAEAKNGAAAFSYTIKGASR